VRLITIPLIVLILSRLSFFLNRLVLLDTKNNDAFRLRLSDAGADDMAIAGRTKLNALEKRQSIPCQQFKEYFEYLVALVLNTLPTGRMAALVLLKVAPTRVKRPGCPNTSYVWLNSPANLRA
jgi:hypothetical protein